MKSLFNVKKHFAIFAIMAVAMMLPDFAYAYTTKQQYDKCTHQIDDATSHCVKVGGCGAYVIKYDYTPQNPGDKNGIKLSPTKDDFGDAIYLGTTVSNGSWYWFFDRQIVKIETGAFSKDKMQVGISGVDVPEGAKEIEAGAFKGVDLQSVTLPSTLTTIGEGAFKDCDKLTSVIIPSNVQTIEAGAFSGCSSLSTVVISEGVKTIEAGAFEDCKGLTSITLPESLETVEGEAFSGCKNLKTVEVKNEETKIDNTSFAGCDKVETVTGTLEQVEVIGGTAPKNEGEETVVTPPNDKIHSITSELLTDAEFAKISKSYPNAEVTFKTYERPVSGTWGTLCLPFAVSSNQDIQLYQLTGVDAKTGVMEFEPISSVGANEPCVFQKLSSATTLSFSSQNDVKIIGETKVVNLFDGWSIVGTYKKLDIDVTPTGQEAGKNIYYFSGNVFYHCVGTVSIKPFRAYFENNNTNNAAVSRFSVCVNAGMETGVKSVSADAEEDALYDLLGNRVDKMVRGRIYILNGKKVMFK